MTFIEDNLMMLLNTQALRVFIFTKMTKKMRII